MQRFYSKRRISRYWLPVALVFSVICGCVGQGSLEYEKESVGAFKGVLQLSGLKKNNDYVLCLNGYPGKPGNDRLPQLYGSEGYIDFTSVTSDENGKIKTEIDVPLEPGKYVVKFLVKDPDANWAMVWQKILVEFTIL